MRHCSLAMVERKGALFLSSLEFIASTAGRLTGDRFSILPYFIFIVHNVNREGDPKWNKWIKSKI